MILDRDDNQSISRILIEAGFMTFDTTTCEVIDEEGHITYITVYGPVNPHFDSDDYYVFDEQGHEYNGSVLRRFVLREAMSSDPYENAQQHDIINYKREQLNAWADSFIREDLRNGKRGLHLEDFDCVMVQNN